jgi:predicted nucleic acid-binding protein
MVLDASALVDLLLRTEREAFVRAWYPGTTPEFLAPDLIGFELTAALRRMVQRGVLPAAHADAALEAYLRLPKRLYPTAGLMRTAWTLRDAVSMADAYYLTLAAALGTPLVTTDERLARTARAIHGDHAAVSPAGPAGP